MIVFHCSEGDNVPSFVHIGSVIAHAWLLVYFYVIILMGDLLPIIFALNYTMSFLRISEDLIDLKSSNRY